MKLYVQDSELVTLNYVSTSHQIIFKSIKKTSLNRYHNFFAVRFTVCRNENEWNFLFSALFNKSLEQGMSKSDANNVFNTNGKTQRGRYITICSRMRLQAAWVSHLISSPTRPMYGTTFED